MRIIIDAMGGDNAPAEIVKGALRARDELGVEICLVGRLEEVKACLGGAGDEYEGVHFPLGDGGGLVLGVLVDEEFVLVGVGVTEKAADRLDFAQVRVHEDQSGNKRLALGVQRIVVFHSFQAQFIDNELRSVVEYFNRVPGHCF